MEAWFFDLQKVSAYKNMVDTFHANQRGMGFSVALYNDAQKGIGVTIGMPPEFSAYTQKIRAMAINIVKLTVEWLQSYGLSQRLVNDWKLRQQLSNWISKNLTDLITVVLNEGCEDLCSIMDEQIDIIEAESVLSSVKFHDGRFWKPDGTYFKNGCWLPNYPESGVTAAYIEQNNRIINALKNNMAAMS